MRAQPEFGHQGVGGNGCFMDSWGDGPILIRWKGKEWRFEFSEMFGPALLTKEGQVAYRQPTDEKHPFWEAFDRWNKAGRRCRRVRTKRGRFRFWLGHVPRHEELI